MYHIALSLLIVLATSLQTVPLRVQTVTDRNVQGQLVLGQRFQPGETAHVAFMGGSITKMEGYRPLVCDMLRGPRESCCLG